MILYWLYLFAIEFTQLLSNEQCWVDYLVNFWDQLLLILLVAVVAALIVVVCCCRVLD
jgi:hypothetical protein